MPNPLRIGLALATLLVATGHTETAGQIRTLFAGKWIAVPPEPGSTPPDLAGPWASEVTLTQDYEALVVEYVSASRSNASVKLIYNLNGTERRDPELTGSAPQEPITRGIGRGRDLMLTTIWNRAEPGPIEITEVLSLTAPDTLTVTLTRRVKDTVATGVWLFRRR
jgi:hypothetical protein